MNDDERPQELVAATRLLLLLLAGCVEKICQIAGCLVSLHHDYEAFELLLW